MFHKRIIALILLLAGFGVGFFVYQTQKSGKVPFRLGLDLNGGTHLVYQADVSKIASDDIAGSMQSLRDVIENRINIFSLSEPLVQVETGKTGSETLHKLIVELPGVTDVSEAIKLIGQTPVLEFKLARSTPVKDPKTGTTTEQVSFVPTGLTGRYLKHTALEFNQQTGEPMVSMTLTSEGADLFAKITKAHVGEVLAIFLDNNPISTPVIRQEISDGKAQISGSFTVKEAQDLVRNLNYGALPVPIALVGTQTIGATLGQDALHKGVRAGLWSFIVIALFLILWYRLPGLLATFALAIYTALMLVLFKIFSVTLTSAGIAGFILSIGMAVDANILIFERMKEELKKGSDVGHATKEGFARAWPSIRDSNISSIITAVILYFFASSTLIKGFALVFLIGVVVSMFTAIVVSRSFLTALGTPKGVRTARTLFSSGFHF